MRLYTRLVTQDKVEFLIGPYSSGITQAVVPLIDKYQMATIEPGASLPDIYTPGNVWNFQGIRPSTGYLEGLLPLAKAQGAKTVAILALKSAYSLACSEARVAQAKSLNMTVVYRTTYWLPQPDFSSIALAVKNADPDVVLACSYYPDSVGSRSVSAASLPWIGYRSSFGGVSIIGANGAGKTTDFNAITGFVTASSADIRYEGESIARLPVFLRAQRRIARTLQIPRLMGLAARSTNSAGDQQERTVVLCRRIFCRPGRNAGLGSMYPASR